VPIASIAWRPRRPVSGNALGVPFTLDRQQLDVIAGFRRRLLPER
jgi:hypothetical protein